MFKGSNFGIAVGGKIESGFVSIGDKLLVMPINLECTVKAIRTTDQNSVEYGMAGDNVEISLLGIEQNTLSVGDILCDPENPVKISKRFNAQIIVFSLEQPILKGQTVEIHHQSLNEPGIIHSLISLLDKSNLEVKQKKPRLLREGDAAIIRIKVNRPICLEKYSDFKQLGRLTLRENGKTIAAGIVTEIQ